MRTITIPSFRPSSNLRSVYVSNRVWGHYTQDSPLFSQYTQTSFVFMRYTGDPQNCKRFWTKCKRVIKGSLLRRCLAIGARRGRARCWVPGGHDAAGSRDPRTVVLWSIPCTTRPRAKPCYAGRSIAAVGKLALYEFRDGKWCTTRGNFKSLDAFKTSVIKEKLNFKWNILIIHFSTIYETHIFLIEKKTN